MRCSWVFLAVGASRPASRMVWRAAASTLGSALVLEFLLYYLTRPEYQIHVREAIYLDNMLDLF